MSEFVLASTNCEAAPRGRTATRQAWAERLTRFAASGLSVAQFCALEGVSAPSFYSLSGHLFIFRNRGADRLKVLYWGGHGLCLWCQRLEAGRYHFPSAPPDATSLELTAGQFQMILDGIDLSRVQRFKRFAPSP